MISDMSSGFEMVENGGLKKASLYDHFEGLTTDSLFWFTDHHQGHCKQGLLHRNI